MMHEFCSIFIWNTVKQRYLTPMVSPDEIQHDHPLPWQPSSVFLVADQSLGSVCPGLPESMSRSELAAADQCLKFCDDTPSAATLTTLNNPCDLDSDGSTASFLVQWTRAHWNAGRPKWQCGVNDVQVLCPAEPQSCCSRHGELPAVNLVRVHSYSNYTVYFSIWLHKHKVCLSKFKTLCKKYFFPSAVVRQTPHSLFDLIWRRVWQPDLDSGSTTNWQFLSTAASTAWLRRTSPTTSSVWRTSTPGIVFAQHQRAHSTCLTRLSTVGDRAFPVAVARVWNSLPADVTLSPSLPTFKRWLKTELFVLSYP